MGNVWLYSVIGERLLGKYLYSKERHTLWCMCVNRMSKKITFNSEIFITKAATTAARAEKKGSIPMDMRTEWIVKARKCYSFRSNSRRWFLWQQLWSMTKFFFRSEYDLSVCVMFAKKKREKNCAFSRSVKCCRQFILGYIFVSFSIFFFYLVVLALVSNWNKQLMRTAYFLVSAFCVFYSPHSSCLSVFALFRYYRIKYTKIFPFFSVSLLLLCWSICWRNLACEDFTRSQFTNDAFLFEKDIHCLLIRLFNRNNKFSVFFFIIIFISFSTLLSLFFRRWFTAWQ